MRIKLRRWAALVGIGKINFEVGYFRGIKSEARLCLLKKPWGMLIIFEVQVGKFLVSCFVR